MDQLREIEERMLMTHCSTAHNFGGQGHKYISTTHHLVLNSLYLTRLVGHKQSLKLSLLRLNCKENETE